MNCPFCKVNYDSEALVDGRCPNCSGIVSWAGDESEEFDAASFSPMVTVSLGPFPVAGASGVSRPEHPPTSLNSNAPKPIGSDLPSNSPNVKSDNKGVPSDKNPPNPALGNSADSLDHQYAKRQEKHAEKARPGSNGSSLEESDSDRENASIRNGRMLNSGAVKKLNRMWRTATSDTTGTLSTLQTDFESDSPSIQIVINERKMNGKSQSALSADYELIEQIGQGAVGVVYAAQQSSIDRQVAVKMLHQQANISDEQKEKFLFEAVVTGDLDHPNIVPIHELGKNQTDDLFYSMKKIDGQPWSESIWRKSLPENLDILMKVCDAVAFAHSRGVVHRDLKPENVMLGEFGEVLVVDWGIALPIAGFSKSELLKSQPSVSGTPAYMAPEMATGPIGKIGIRSDVYLIGAILFEIICKKPPHSGKSTMDCVLAAAKNQINPTDATEAPMSIAMKALETEPANRYASVPDFQAAIREYQSHLESITLSDRAEDAFTAATETRDYQDFSRASYAYAEALELWDDNEAAKEGLRKTNLAYAQCALEKSDFDLGLSLIDSEEEEFADVADAIRAGIAIRDRRQSLVTTLRNVAVALVLLIFGGGYLAYNQQVQGRKKVDELLAKEQKTRAEKEKALDEKVKALDAEESAKIKANNAKIKADNATDKAENSEREAVKAREKAEKARGQVDENLRRLAEKTYISEIGAANEKISMNAISAARDIAEDIQKNSGGLLHWEWGRIDQICNGESDEVASQQQLNDKLIESLAIRRRTANLEEILAVGRSTGRVDLISTKLDRRIGTIEFDNERTCKISEVAFSPDGRLLVVAGQINNQGIAKIWNVDRIVDRMDDPLMTLPQHGTKINSVAFTPMSNRLLTAADDNTMKLWQLSDLNLIRIFNGHLGPIWDCDFAPNGLEFASASEDGTVRLWSVAASTPNRRFAEHEGPVYCVRFLPDAESLVSAGSDKRVLRWTIKRSSFSEAGNNEQESSLVEATKQRVDGLSSLDKSQNRTTVEAFGLRRKDSDSQVLGTHENAIRILGLSHDGKTLVSGGDDNLIKLWEIGQQKPTPSNYEQNVLRGHGSWIRGASFSSNNQALFSGGYDREIRFWNLNSKRNKIVIQSESQTVACEVSPKGDRLVTTTEDGKAKVWDTKTGKELALLQDGHRFLSTTAVVTPDGGTMFTAAGDNTVRVWDYRTGIETKTINNTGLRSLMSLSRDGRRIATGESGEDAIRIFDVQTGKLIQRLTPETQVMSGNDQSVDITTFALSDDGSYVIAGDSYGNCFLWEIENQRLVANWRGHFTAVVSVNFTSGKVSQSDDLTFVTAGREGVAATWSFNVGKTPAIDPEKQLRVKLSENRSLIRNALTKRSTNPLTSMLLDRSREHIAITTQYRNSDNEPIANGIEVINLLNGKRSYAKMAYTKIHSLCFQPEDPNQILIAASGIRQNKTLNGRLNASVASKPNSLLYLWDRKLSPKPQPHFQGPDLSRVANMLLPIDGNQLLLVGGKGVRQWDLKSGTLNREFRSHGRITCASISPNSKLVATGGVEKTVKVWDIESAKSIYQFQNKNCDKISAVQFLSDELILIADESGFVFLVDISKPQMTDNQPLLENGSKVNSICVSADKELIFLGCDDGVVSVWNLASKTKLKTLEHSDRVLSVAISDDGRLLATGTADNLGHVWDAVTWKKVGESTGHAAPVTSVRFSADRIRLLSASQDGNASVWDLTPTIQSREIPTENEPLSPDSISQLTEVFALTENSDPLAGAFFVDDGRNVATCCVNGLTTIFRGSDIESALRLTRGSLVIKPNVTVSLDPSILFVCPTTENSNEFEIRVGVESPEKDGPPVTFVSLELSDNSEQKDRHFQVIDGSIQQKNHGDSMANTQWTNVGEITSKPQSLSFHFTNEARIETIESVLRSILCKSSARMNSPQQARATYQFLSKPESLVMKSNSLLIRMQQE